MGRKGPTGAETESFLTARSYRPRQENKRWLGIAQSAFLEVWRFQVVSSITEGFISKCCQRRRLAQHR